MANYTKEDLLKYQQEINHFKKVRKFFLILGWALIGAGILIGIPLAIIVVANGGKPYIVSYVVATFIVAGIVLFVLRAALFNRRIGNRKNILEEAKEQSELEELYKEADKI